MRPPPTSVQLESGDPTASGRMNAPVAFIYHEIYDGRGFSRLEDSWRRYRLARELLEELGMFAGALRLFRPEPATDYDILTVHTPSLLGQDKGPRRGGRGLPRLWRHARL